MLNESDWQWPYCDESDPGDNLDAERERTLMELEAQIGPRPRVATVLRMMRMRRGRR